MEQGTCTIGDGECSKTGKLTRGWCQKHYQRWQRTGSYQTVTIIQGNDNIRFWSKVDKRGPDECWPWTGPVGKQGYAQFSVGGKTVKAHRWSYENSVEPIPEGLDVDHLCHKAGECLEVDANCLHRRCMNPAHLKPKPHRDNVLRGNGTAAVNARKTHCDSGHEFTPENTYAQGNGARGCKACERDRTIRRYGGQGRWPKRESAA
jgi:hypothetical protein